MTNKSPSDYLEPFFILVSTSLTLLFVTPVAYRLATRRFRVTTYGSIIDLPTVRPSVAGVALLMAFGRNGLIGSFLADIGITIPFTFFAVFWRKCSSLLTSISSPLRWVFQLLINN
jgi:ABC-type sulfate transport system permease component